MITTPVLVFATVAFSAVCSFGAPIKVRRDGSEVQQFGRRFPQNVAADSPVLAKKEVIETPVADTVVRRFPRRIYYEYYNKRETPDVAERSPAPESASEARSIADEALDDLAARKMRRERRRSNPSTHFKRILERDGVVARREEPKMKRSVVVAREPEPAPVKESRAFIPPLKKRDSMIPAPVIESRAFIPPAPAADLAARDTFVWTINAGLKVEEFADVKQIQKINDLPPSSPSTVGSASATPTSTESSPESKPTAATGTGEEGSPTPTSTSPSSETSTASGSKSSGNSTESGTPCTEPAGSNSASNSQKPSSQKPPVMDTLPQRNSSDTNATSNNGNGKRDEQSPSPIMRRGSPKWRRIVPAPSLSRRSKSASSALQYKR
jgi:neural Wiskott-Aldrich syndrome protein